MILITGAGGKTGKSLIKALSKTKSVGALVHREEYVSGAKSLGAEKVIAGDMRSELVIRSAMHNVRAVYHICPNMNPDEATIGQRIIDIARENGVGHFVYHSVLHPQTQKMNHHWQKLRVEEMLFESGLPFTILQPAPFMQNLLAGWKSILEDGILHVPYSVNSQFSFIDLENLAEAARTVLTEPNHTSATYELAGTLPMSHAGVAETFSRVSHRDLLLGFSWGYHIADDGGVTLEAIAALSTAAWQSHPSYLRETYPKWQFTEMLPDTSDL